MLSRVGIFRAGTWGTNVPHSCKAARSSHVLPVTCWESAPVWTQPRYFWKPRADCCLQLCMPRPLPHKKAWG